MSVGATRVGPDGTDVFCEHSALTCGAKDVGQNILVAAWDPWIRCVEFVTVREMLRTAKARLLPLMLAAPHKHCSSHAF